MEDEAPVSGDEPPPGFSFPKPDFSEIAVDDPGEILTPEKNDLNFVQKPTFKSALQAKKRLQAFSNSRGAPLPLSPVAKKTRPVAGDEKSEEQAVSPVKKGTKKGLVYHDDKAKAVIEEIEEIKRIELAQIKAAQRRSRSRSASRATDRERERFKKVEKKSRNYRRRSVTPDKRKKPPPSRKPKKYPKSWREFVDFRSDFDLNRDIVQVKGNNEPLRQMLFESPSLPIIELKMKDANGREEKAIPFEHVRYTRAKPPVSYCFNFSVIRSRFLSKEFLLKTLPKETVTCIEKLYFDSLKFKSNDLHKVRSWYAKNWSVDETECKLLEQSAGLSFLQNYTDDDNDVVVEEKETEEMKKKLKNYKDKKKHKVGKKETEVGNEPVKKKNTKKERKKKKLKEHKDEGVSEDVGNPKQPKKVKTKTKKEKSVKEKRPKKKRDKDKKKDKPPTLVNDKPTKQQVIDELKIIEEKLAKKREQARKQEKPEKGRKRKNSERDEDSYNKRTKHADKKKIKNEDNCDKIKKKEETNSKLKQLEDIVNDSQKVIEQIELKLEQGGMKNEVTPPQPKMSEDRTPDTDEYHSHWESDDDVHNRKPIKTNRSWESDEELFERPYQRNQTISYANLEIPLNITGFSRRSQWDSESELRQLDEERKILNEERKQLELEKQKILKLQEEQSMMGLGDGGELKKDVVVEEERGRLNDELKAPKPEPSVVDVKKESVVDFNIDSLNSSLLSNVSSVDSNFPITVLENEYEEFIKAVSSDSPSVCEKKKSPEKPTDVLSSISSSSSDSDHKAKRKKRKKQKRKKKKIDGLLPGKVNNIFNEFDIPAVPIEMPDLIPVPVPVPSPNLQLLSSIVDEVKVVEPPTTIEDNTDQIGLDLSKPFLFSSITLTPKKPLLDTKRLKLDDDSDSGDFTDKFKNRDFVKVLENEAIREVKTDVIVIKSPVPDGKFEVGIKKIQAAPLTVQPVRIKRSRSRSRDRRRTPATPMTGRRRFSPLRRRPSPRRRGGSPRRRSPSPRRRRRRSPSLSPPPRRGGGLRKRTPSPRIRRSSPLNSPLDGFKKSVADSTISDDMLPQLTPDEYSESPPTFEIDRRIKSVSPAPASPRRIPLDERISQVLGLEETRKKEYQQQQQQQNYGWYGYGQYNTHPYGQSGVFIQPPPPPSVNINKSAPTKVVQVGNILQVVPHEDIVNITSNSTIQANKLEQTQKIVQVGNMLQIVPGHSIPDLPLPTPKTVSIEPVPAPVKVEKEIAPAQSTECLMKQKKAEREVRRLERERRRKDKERMRKEKEKRKQMKLKLKTENMIKRAIQLETEALANEDDDDEEGEDLVGDEIQWQQTPVQMFSGGSPAKSILLTPGSSKKRKSVQFADGVRPGEGTSPSGGEELSSPPPSQHPKLPKEKRLKKLKAPVKKSKKKKIKVKVVKRSQGEEETDDEDNLPPPSPPPGSPPPHVFPSRVKTHTINNVHQYVGGVIQPPPQYAFRTQMPPPHMVMGRPPTHQPPPGYLPTQFHPPPTAADLSRPPPPANMAIPPPPTLLSHPPPTYQGVSSLH